MVDNTDGGKYGAYGNIFAAQSLAELLVPLDEAAKLTAEALLRGEREEGEKLVRNHRAFGVLLDTPDKMEKLFKESHKLSAEARQKYQPEIADKKVEAIEALLAKTGQELIREYDAAEKVLRLVTDSTTRAEVGIAQDALEQAWITHVITTVDKRLVDDFLETCRDASERRHRALLKELVPTLTYLLDCKSWYQSRRSDVLPVLALMKASLESPRSHAMKYAAKTCDRLRTSLRIWVKHLEGGKYVETDKTIKENILHPFVQFIRTPDKAA